MTTSAGEKASTLVEALPYIRRFWGKTVVVKYGGNALAGATDGESGESAALSLFAEDIVLMRAVGMSPVVVHGGGPQITDLMERLGKVPEFRDGLRVTDAETVDIARMVLVGKVNPGIVAAINVHGALAVGVSGESAGLIEASPQDPALGFVGEVARVNPRSSNGCSRRISSRSSPRSARGRTGRRTTSTPTSSRARWPRHCTRRSSCT